jgi:hypothetical protein
MKTSVKDNFESDIRLSEKMLRDMKMRLVNLLQYNATPANFACTGLAITSVCTAFQSL